MSDIEEGANFSKAAWSELKKSPIQASMAVCNFVVAFAALIVAWRAGGNSFAAPSNSAAANVGAASYAITLAAFLAGSSFTAFVSRTINRADFIAGFCFSVVLSILTMLLVALVARSQGVVIGAVSDTKGLIAGGVILIFAAYCGRDMLEAARSRVAAKARPNRNAQDNYAEANSDVLLMVGFWLFLVVGGATRATAILG